MDKQTLEKTVDKTHGERTKDTLCAYAAMVEIPMDSAYAERAIQWYERQIGSMRHLTREREGCKEEEFYKKVAESLALKYFDQGRADQVEVNATENVEGRARAEEEYGGTRKEVQGNIDGVLSEPYIKNGIECSRYRTTFTAEHKKRLQKGLAEKERIAELGYHVGDHGNAGNFARFDAIAGVVGKERTWEYMEITGAIPFGAGDIDGIVDKGRDPERFNRYQEIQELAESFSTAYLEKRNEETGGSE